MLLSNPCSPSMLPQEWRTCLATSPLQRSLAALFLLLLLLLLLMFFYLLCLAHLANIRMHLVSFVCPSQFPKLVNLTSLSKLPWLISLAMDPVDNKVRVPESTTELPLHLLLLWPHFLLFPVARLLSWPLLLLPLLLLLLRQEHL